MKKIITSVLLLSLLLLCACGTSPVSEPVAEPTAVPTAEPTEEPSPTPTPFVEPETEEATVIALTAPAVLARLDRGDSVELMGRDSKYHDCYIVKSEKGYGLMRSQFLRLDGEEPYESWTGHALAGAVLYTDYTMSEVLVEALEKDAELTVLEKLDNCYVVSLDDKVGVISLAGVISPDRQSVKGGSSDGSSGGGIDYSGGSDGGSSSGGSSDAGGYSGGGSSGGGYSGGGGGGGSSGGGGGWDGVSRDGGDIVISGRSIVPSPALEKLATVIEQKDGEISGKAEVVISGAPILGAVYERGEKVRVFEWGDETTTLYILGFYADTETRFLRRADDEAYKTWRCYSKQGSKLYSDIAMVGADYIPLNKNVEFEVLEDFGDCYLIENNDAIGYIAHDQVTDSPVTGSVYSADGGSSGGGSSGGSYSGGGYSGGGSSGGGSSGGGTSSGWTAPVY